MTYKYSQYLGIPIAVNCTSDGATVAVIQSDGTIHPDYVNNPLTLQWIADTPDWEAVIAALPEPEPEPSQPDWASFFDALIITTAYQHIAANAPNNPQVFRAYTDTSVNLGMAKLGAPNIGGLQANYDIIKNGLNAMAVPLTTEHLTALQNLVDAYNIPLIL